MCADLGTTRLVNRRAKSAERDFFSRIIERCRIRSAAPQR